MEISLNDETDCIWGVVLGQPALKIMSNLLTTP